MRSLRRRTVVRLAEAKRIEKASSSSGASLCDQAEEGTEIQSVSFAGAMHTVQLLSVA